MKVRTDGLKNTGKILNLYYEEIQLQTITRDFSITNDAVKNQFKLKDDDCLVRINKPFHTSLSSAFLCFLLSLSCVSIPIFWNTFILFEMKEVCQP